MKIYISSSFEKNLNKLNQKESEKLLDIFKKLVNMEITSQANNHPLKNANGLHDLHISPNVILLYKYDDEKDLLEIALKLVDFSDHDKLVNKIKKFRKNQYKFKEKSQEEIQNEIANNFNKRYKKEIKK